MNFLNYKKWFVIMTYIRSSGPVVQLEFLLCTLKADVAFIVYFRHDQSFNL